MRTEYTTLYISTDTEEADEILLAFGDMGWKVVCSCATNRLILVKETDEPVDAIPSMENVVEEIVPIDPIMFNEMTKKEQIEFFIEILESDAEHGAEEGHILADYTLCQLLTSLGYGKVAEKFESLKKWYS